MAAFGSRSQAIEWAKSMIGRSDVVYVDTETTGVRYGQDDVIDIGIVNGSGIVLMDQLVKPLVPVPADAEAVHGISNKVLQSAPTIAEIWNDLSTLLNGKLLISYNADFDRQMIFSAGQRRSMTPILPLRWDCAMEAFAAFNGERSHHRRGFKWINLGTAAWTLGLEQPAHRAVADALVCLEVVQEMSRRS